MKIRAWAESHAWVAWLLCVPIVWQGGLWLTDRSPPFAITGAVVTVNARPGDMAFFTALVRRDLDRDCSVLFTRHLIDGKGMRFDLSKEPGVLTAEGLQAMDAAMGGYLRLAVAVPESAAPGPAIFATNFSYMCNPIHRAWPIEVSMSMLFVIEDPP